GACRHKRPRVWSIVRTSGASSAKLRAMPTTDDAAKIIAERAKEIEEELAELVEINSFTDNTEGGHEVGELLVERTFLVPQLNYRIVESKRSASHRVFSSRGDASRRPIALIGHLDTVFPPGTFEGFKRDGDLARGPGVLDMKGGLVVVAWALKALAAAGVLGSLPGVRLVIVADEEVGSPEGQSIIQRTI